MNTPHFTSIMKTAACTFIIFMSGMLCAQKNSNQRFAICNNVIGTMKMFNNYKEQTEKATFFKNKTDLPSNLKKFEFLASNGLTEIKLKKNAGTPDIISLEMLNEQYGMPKDNPVSIDGYLFDDPQTTIYSEIVIKGDIKNLNDKKILYLATSEN